MMDGDGDSNPFSLGQPLSDPGGYPVVNSSLTGQYGAWVTATSASAISSTNDGSSGDLPNQFSPVSPSGHGPVYDDHLGLHSSQAVDVLSVRLGPNEYHSGQSDRMSGTDSYHSAFTQAENSGLIVGQTDYHSHLSGQTDRHLSVESYGHHLPSSSSAQQQTDHLGQGDYHASQNSRLTQSNYHTASQDRLSQTDYHSSQTSDRLGQVDYYSGQQDRLSQSDYHGGQSQDRLSQLGYSSEQTERLGSLSSQNYHGAGQSDRLSSHQQAGEYHSGQSSDRTLGSQVDYHQNQVDLDSVGIHSDFERRHLDTNLLTKDLVDNGQRGAAIDYLTGQNSRDPLATLHRDIVGLQRELDLSVGQPVSPPQRGTASDLAATSYSLDPTALPRDLSPYSQRELDRAMMTADIVVSQPLDGSSRSGGVNAHSQDLASVAMGKSRDLVDMTSLTRGVRDDLGRVHDSMHRPRDIQRALEVLGSLENSARGDMGTDLSLTSTGGASSNSSNKTATRSYQPIKPNLSSSNSMNSKRPNITQTSMEARTVAAFSAANPTAAAINFLPLTSARDPLALMATSDPSVGTSSSRHMDFTRQQANDMNRLRRELSVPYADLSLHHSILTSSGVVSLAGYKTSLDTLFAPPDQTVCAEMLTSSRERLYEMMKQHQFCDAILATTLHSVKVE